MPPSTPNAFSQQTFRQLVEIEKGALGNLLRRGHVPFHEEADGWTEYTYRQAFAARIAFGLGKFIELSTSRSLVENYLDAFIKKFGQDLLQGRPVHFGYATFFAFRDEGRLGTGRHSYSSGVVAGDLACLFESRVGGDVGDPIIDFVPLGSQKEAARQLVLIDATFELARLRSIANDNPKATEWLVENAADA